VAERRSRRTDAALTRPDLLLESFAETLRAADAALESPSAGPGGERRLVIAGVGVRVKFAGPRLAQILDPAFGHLSRRAPPPGAPADHLAVTVIDGGLFGPPPLAAHHFFGGGQGLRLRPGNGSPPSLCGDYGDGGLTILDLERGRCLHWVHEISKVPGWAAASPLRTPLGLLLATRGRYLLHGAAIGQPSGAVLLAAKGGSGKSTSALACLDAASPLGAPRLLVAGDDFVVLEPDPAAPRVHALFGTAKIGRTHAALFPGLERLVVRDGGPLDVPGEKAVLRLLPDAADRLAPVLPLRAIAVPVLGLDRPESRIEPLSRSGAMLALAPSSIFLVQGAGAETLDAVTRLVAGLPCYHLRIGRDVRGIPLAIEALLAQVAGETAPPPHSHFDGAGRTSKRARG
jgi:hypothetical protein